MGGGLPGENLIMATFAVILPAAGKSSRFRGQEKKVFANLDGRAVWLRSAELFVNRWCILTPPDGSDPMAVETLRAFWAGMGARVEIMTPDHHDLVLAITSHLPHLIAYTIVGTADELAQVTSSEVIKFSAGGFRDFTRIAASDPTMWRDVFLNNKEAVLEMLGTFNEDLSKLTRAIRRNDGEALFEHFTRTRAIRRGIVEIGQDSPAPDFGRAHPGLPDAPLPRPYALSDDT